MSATWDSKGLKTTPLEADELLIIDTADSRNQKRATLTSIPFTLADNSVTDAKIATHVSTKITGLPTQTQNLNLGGNTVILDTNQTIVPSSAGVTHNLPTADLYDFKINNVSIFSVDAIAFRINSGLFVNSVTAGITASTTQTQGQGALTTTVNEVSVVANTNDTITLPNAIAGIEVVIINPGRGGPSYR